MKLIRFMGMPEFIAYLKGEDLENHKDWKMNGSRTESVGFCFFDDSESPEYRLHYLRGIVDPAICVEFETAGPINLKRAQGVYAKPEAPMKSASLRGILRGLGSKKVKKVTEYSTEHYNMHTLKLVRAGIPDMRNYLDYKIHWRDREAWLFREMEKHEKRSVSC